MAPIVNLISIQAIITKILSSFGINEYYVDNTNNDLTNFINTAVMNVTNAINSNTIKNGGANVISGWYKIQESSYSPYTPNTGYYKILKIQRNITNPINATSNEQTDLIAFNNILLTLLRSPTSATLPSTYPALIKYFNFFQPFEALIINQWKTSIIFN